MEQKPIKRMRTNRNDINRIFGMFAGLQELESASKEMEQRFRLIPNGWRDLKMCIAVLDKLMNNIVMTVPAEKLVSMNRMLPKMRFKLSCGAQACETGKEECIISMEEANALSHYAHEHCKMCFEDNCDRCPLGKTFDHVLSYDRDGGSWANVDFNWLREQYEEDK